MESKNNISTSMFYMWRCVVAIAHLDGGVSLGERAYLEKIFSNIDRVYGLSDEQEKAFANDLINPQRIDDLLPHINDPEYRAMLITFGETLAWLDGNVAPEEDAILKKLHADQLASIDIVQLREEIREIISFRRAERIAEMEKIREEIHQRSPHVAVIDNLLRKIGIDILQ